MKRLCLLLLLCCSLGYAQTKVVGLPAGRVDGDVEITGTATVGEKFLPPSGAALPSACTVGSVFYKTGASAGLYSCDATDTWTRVRRVIRDYPTCNGSTVPCQLHLTGQTAAITDTTLYTAPAEGQYRVTMSYAVTQTGTGTLTPVLKYGGVLGLTPALSGLNMSSGNYPGTAVVSGYLAEGGVLKYGTSGTITGTYRLDIVVE